MKRTLVCLLLAAAAVVVADNSSLVTRHSAADSLVVITANGQIIRMSVAGIRECGRGSSGVKVVDVSSKDRVISASVVPGEESAPVTGADDASAETAPSEA